MGHRPSEEARSAALVRPRPSRRRAIDMLDERSVPCPLEFQRQRHRGVREWGLLGCLVSLRPGRADHSRWTHDWHDDRTGGIPCV